MSFHCPWVSWCFALAALLAARTAVVAQTTNDVTSSIPSHRIEQLRALTLEQILHKEISSVSKRPEDWFKAPAAVFVITDEDLRRSGVRSFADALRLAPGMQVSQADASQWAVSARGFNDIFADKLLVLRDGRTLYSPINAGVFWGMQDYIFEDVDRIEVIRGPGGTLWGANAVNGVINIISKDARDTLGTYATAGGGTAERAFGEARHGFQLSENGYARAYVQGWNRDSLPRGHDDADFVQGGFRSDWHLDQNHYTVQGDYFHSRRGVDIGLPRYTAPYFPLSSEDFKTDGVNALSRWTHTFSDESDLQLQAYYDRVDRDFLGAEGLHEIYDIDFQHRFPLPLNQSLLYGASYRYYPDRVESDPVLLYSPRERHSQLFSVFLQDEIALVPERLKLTLGAKLEHNDYTGAEIQPSGRLAWTPNDHHTIWAAVSRAVQIPSRANRDITAPILAVPPMTVSGLPLFVRGIANPDVDAQELIAYELGYRVQPLKQLSFDVTGFYNDYVNLITGNVGTPFFEAAPVPHLVLPVSAQNGGEAQTWGAEVAANWQAMDELRLSATYSYMELRFDRTVGSEFSEGRDPAHQASLRSSLDLGNNWQFDIWGRFVDELVSYGVDSYFDVDARLSWKVTRNVEFSVVGQNLIDNRRIEFGSSTTVRTRITPATRSVYGQLTLRF